MNESPTPAAGASAATSATAGAAGVWQLPPPWALLVAVLLIIAAEVGGASMARFKVETARWARGLMLARPEVHGLVGVRDVDERILDEALVKVDAGLRLFHLHAEGMGLVIIATTTVAATLVASRRARSVLIVLFTAGGAGYPLGYLLWSGLIPVVGLDRARAIAEWLVWIPFGGATIVALWWLAAAVALRLNSSWGAPGAPHAPPRSGRPGEAGPPRGRSTSSRALRRS